MSTDQGSVKMILASKEAKAVLCDQLSRLAATPSIPLHLGLAKARDSHIKQDQDGFSNHPCHSSAIRDVPHDTDWS